MAAPVLSVQQPTQIFASENWDDDFEFQQESTKSELRPRPKHAGSKDKETRKLSIASSTALEDWDTDERSSNLPLPSSSSRTIHHHHHQQHTERQTENWDDDFEDRRNSPEKVVNSSPGRRKEDRWDENLDLDEETEDDSGAEFGFAEKEEDRTVTAKSRRAALKRLSSSSNKAPPLPLPTNFLLNISQQPFPPRSPTSSVFSIPTTTHTFQTHDHYYSSTTHLRPTSAFALLPPSPPIYKDRERRRLRKKSRPKPHGMFELASLRGSINASDTRLGSSRFAGPSDSKGNNRHSFSDEGDAEPSPLEPSQPILDARRLKEGPSTDTSSADDRRSVTPALTVPSLPQTPAKGTALLSRIGSVKRWGVRRKRASTTPSEVIAQEPNNIDVNRTPRVKSSRSSFHGIISSRNSMATPPPRQEPTTSTSKRQSDNNNTNHHNTTGQSSNWFFRASSAGSPHSRAGGWTGRSASGKGNTGKEEAHDDQPGSRRRSGSVSRSRSRTGRMGSSYLNGSRTELSHNTQGRVPSTPSKLVKRKSIGFISLRKSSAPGKQAAEPDIIDSPRKGRYVGIGLGRAAAGRGVDGEAGEGDASEPEGGDTRQERRSRRKSFTRFLFDRDKENESNASSKSEFPEKEKDGSRGFMGSVRRISLVGGKHKRTKSGSGIVGGGIAAPPLPSASSPLTPKSKPPSSNLPYSLPPLPITSSQFSLRLPSPSAGKQPSSRTSSKHDLPSSFSLQTIPASRTASGETQTSNSSSVLPPSSVSSRSSRATTGSEMCQETPRPPPPQRKTSTRSRISGESTRPKKSTSSAGRPSLDAKVNNNDVSFVTKLSNSGGKTKEHNVTSPPQPTFSVLSPALVSSSSAPPLLPPIELHPPSPPRTLTKGAIPESNPSDILTTIYSNSTSKLSHSGSSSSVFFTPSSSPQRHPIGSASPKSSRTNKLRVPSPQHNGKIPPLLQQSASLGRATIAGGALSSTSPPRGGNGNSGPNGSSPHPRRNSLGDLKIPARISQAQVGLRRDLGMVREFANNIEQLKELQRTYDALVVEIQSILDAHVIRHEQQQAQLSSAPPTASGDTTGSFPVEKRPRANTTESAFQSEPNRDAPVTPAQIAYNELASAFYVINSKYRITWECADLLIDLGGGSVNGNGNDDYPSPPASISAPAAVAAASVHASGIQESIGVKVGRERAITLTGDESKPTQPFVAVPDADCISPISSLSNGSALTSPPSISWRTSTGRQDLSQRQLVLLREMLNNAHAHANVGADTVDVFSANSQPDASIPVLPSSRSHHTQPRMRQVAVNKEWRWGDSKNSTVTLPSEDNRFDSGKAFFTSTSTSTDHKRRSGKLGMSGLRDMLRALKKSANAGGGELTTATTRPHAPMVPAIPIQSTTSLSTESSTGSRRLRKTRQTSQRRRNNNNRGLESIRSVSEDVNGELRTPYVGAAKASPRRPSLASIFRMGSKTSRPSSNTTNDEAVGRSRSRSGGGTGEDNNSSSSSVEEDWDRMDSASDLDVAARALGLSVVVDGSATVRGGNGRTRKSPYLHQQPDLFAPEQSLQTKRSFGASQVSIPVAENQFSPSSSIVPPPLRSVRLSNVEEHDTDEADNNNNNNVQQQTLSSYPTRSVSQTHSNTQSRLVHNPPFPGFSKSSGGGGGGSVRSMPATYVTSSSSNAMSPPPPRLQAAAEPKPPLAMTPENIKPLLENAKELQARLGDCIAELRALVRQS